MFRNINGLLLVKWRLETTLELALELQNRADSEMECLNPHGEVEYEALLVPALLALNFSDSEVQAFWPYGSSGVQSDSFSVVEDSISCNSEEILSDIEELCR
ncbi:hypothetical protein V6N13_044970 [Hibiscus sabdariffa]